MTRIPHRLLLSALIAVSAAAATAQTPAPAPAPAAEPAAQAASRAQRGPADPAKMQQRMAKRQEQRMADLKAKLNLTPAQEPAWTALTAAMQPPARAPRMSRAERDQLTTPERIDLEQKRAAEREAFMKERGDAIKAFYSQLSPEQQQTFDQQHGPQGKRQAMRRGAKKR